MNKDHLKNLRNRWNTHTVDSKNEHYVYLYQYPKEHALKGKIFYVGKGKGERVFAHLDLLDKDDLEEIEKVRVIKEIDSLGFSPDIYILRDNLTESEAFKVESSIIDLLGLTNLSNLQSGHDSQLQHIEDSHRVAEYAIFEHDMLGIKINRTFGDHFSIERYEFDKIEHQRILNGYTSYAWRINIDRLKRYGANYYCAIVNGIIKEVYQFDTTEPALKVSDAINRGIIVQDGVNRFINQPNMYVSIIGIPDNKRVILLGRVAKEIRDTYVGKQIYLKSQQGIRYLAKGNIYKD
jgi:hypothetical protein